MLAGGSPSAVPSTWMTPSFLGAMLVYGLRGDDASEARWLEARGPSEPPVRSGAARLRRFVLPRIALHRGDVDGAVRQR